MITGFIGWMVFGLVAGAIARFLHPGYDQMGLIGTMILGMIGSLVGGGIAYAMHLGDTPYAPGGWIMSIVGAILVLWMGLLGSGSRTVA